MPKNDSLKSRGLVPTIHPEPDFSGTNSFHKMVDNVKLTKCMKFQDILMTGCIDIKIMMSKYP